MEPRMTLKIFSIFAALASCGHSAAVECDIGGMEILRSTDVLQAIPQSDWPPEFTCESESIDAAILTLDRKTYFFKGQYYWKLNGSLLAPGYPRPISSDWDGLPGDLDAAVSVRSAKNFFFKGSEYWRFTEKKMDAGYPKQISEGFCGLPNDIDAVQWSKWGHIFVFKGDQVWRFYGGDDPKNRRPLEDPNPTCAWNGLNGRPDAAIRWEDGYVYYFKNGYFYRYNGDQYGLEAGIETNGHWGLSCSQLQRRILIEKDASPQ